MILQRNLKLMLLLLLRWYGIPVIIIFIRYRYSSTGHRRRWYESGFSSALKPSAVILLYESRNRVGQMAASINLVAFTLR